MEKKVGMPKGKKTYRARVPALLTDPLTKEVIHLNKRERQIIDSVPGSASIKEVAKKHHACAKRVSETIQLPAVQEYFRQMLAKNGVTDNLIAKTIKAGMEATTTKEFLNKEGNVVEGTEFADHEQRGRYVDRALRLQGLDRPQDLDGEAARKRASININIASLTVEELKTLAQALTVRPASHNSPAAAPDVQEAEVIEDGDSTETGAD